MRFRQHVESLQRAYDRNADAIDTHALRAITRRRTVLVNDLWGVSAGLVAARAVQRSESLPAVWVTSKKNAALRLAQAQVVLPGRNVEQAQGKVPYPLNGADVVVVQHDLLAVWQDMLAALRPDALMLFDCNIARRGTQRFGVLHRLISALPDDALVLINSDAAVNHDAVFDLLHRT